MCYNIFIKERKMTMNINVNNLGFPEFLYGIIDEDNTLVSGTNRNLPQNKINRFIFKFSKNTATRSLRKFKDDERANGFKVCKLAVSLNPSCNDFAVLYSLADENYRCVALKSSAFIYPKDLKQYRFYYSKGTSKSVYGSNLKYREEYPDDFRLYIKDRDEVKDVSRLTAIPLYLSIQEIYN